jgi:hypothetical protein
MKTEAEKGLVSGPSSDSGKLQGVIQVQISLIQHQSTYVYLCSASERNFDRVHSQLLRTFQTTHSIFKREQVFLHLFFVTFVIIRVLGRVDL